MRKSTLTLALLLVSLFNFGQGLTEKSWDKFNVQTIEVLGHKFSVGDTLTFTIGSMPNGEFLCTQLRPLLFMTRGETPPHVSANFINLKFIIEKIRYIKKGLNSQSTLVIYIAKNTPLWIDATIAITKKEIVY